MTKGERRKQMEIALSEAYGIAATKEQINSIRVTAAILAG